jgi:hypothetical protein
LKFFLTTAIFNFLEEANLGSLVRGNSMRASNHSIDSISNSLIDENKYNVKKRWMYDNKEFSEVGKSILGISEQRSDANPYGQNNFSETAFSKSSSKNINSVAYGSDGKAFGVVPKELITQIEEAGDDWNSKNMAIEMILEIIQETSSLNTIISYAPSFLRFLWKELNKETNPKIVTNLLKMINKILSINEVLYKVSDQTLANQLVKKLADSNIQIRQLVTKAFLSIMRGRKQSTYISMLAPYLNSSNWHVREEILHLILISILNGIEDIDYYLVVDSIAKLLDDQKSTVRFTWRETLAALVLKGDQKKVCEILYEKVEKKTYNKLCDRFEIGNWPIFYEESLMFDFPIHTNEVLSRASSRGSTFSDSSKRPKHNTTRSRIGDSPLTSKEFDLPKDAAPLNKEYSHTVADNYKIGPTPSERMRKFNSGQVPKLHSYDGQHSLIEDYNNLSTMAKENDRKSGQPTK